MISTVSKTGNSLTVVVPAKFAKKVGVRPGDQVSVEIREQKGQVVYTFLNIRQLPLV